MKKAIDDRAATDRPGVSARVLEPIRNAGGAIIGDLLNFIFPPECIVCENRLTENEMYYCGACRDAADDIPHPLCPGCRIEVDDPRAGCGNCRKFNPISALWSCGTFDRFYRPIVHGIKYHALLPLAPMMADILASRIGGPANSRMFDLIVPIPLHWTRRRERGFNQSRVIALELAKRLGVPVADDVIRRVRRTLDQTGLNAEERINNMKGAFSAGPTDAIADKRVLLVDDVTTTGATLNEAAKELRAAGCRNVFAAVIAVASYG